MPHRVKRGPFSQGEMGIEELQERISNLQGEMGPEDGKSEESSEQDGQEKAGEKKKS